MPDPTAARRRLRCLHATARRIPMFKADDDNRRGWLEAQFDVDSFKNLSAGESHLCLDLLNAMAKGDAINRIRARVPPRRGSRPVFPSQPQLDLALGLACQCFAPQTSVRLQGLIARLTGRRADDLLELSRAEYDRVVGALRGSLGLGARPRRSRSRRTGSLATDRPGRQAPGTGRVARFPAHGHL